MPRIEPGSPDPQSNSLLRARSAPPRRATRNLKLVYWWLSGDQYRLSWASLWFAISEERVTVIVLAPQSIYHKKNCYRSHTYVLLLFQIELSLLHHICPSYRTTELTLFFFYNANLGRTLCSAGFFFCNKAYNELHTGVNEGQPNIGRRWDPPLTKFLSRSRGFTRRVRAVTFLLILVLFLIILVFDVFSCVFWHALFVKLCVWVLSIHLCCVINIR